MVRQAQGHRQRACARQTDQEEDATVHASQATQRILERQAQHAAAVDLPGPSEHRPAEHEQRA